MKENSLEIILTALRIVEPNQITIEQDKSTGELAAKVILRQEQLAEALRENGRFVREAAMTTGIRIDVEMAKDETA